MIECHIHKSFCYALLCSAINHRRLVNAPNRCKLKTLFQTRTLLPLEWVGIFLFLSANFVDFEGVYFKMWN